MIWDDDKVENVDLYYERGMTTNITQVGADKV